MHGGHDDDAVIPRNSSELAKERGELLDRNVLQHEGR